MNQLHCKIDRRVAADGQMRVALAQERGEIRSAAFTGMPNPHHHGAPRSSSSPSKVVGNLFGGANLSGGVHPAIVSPGSWDELGDHWLGKAA